MAPDYPTPRRYLLRPRGVQTASATGFAGHAPALGLTDSVPATARGHLDGAGNNTLSYLPRLVGGGKGLKPPHVTSDRVTIDENSTRPPPVW